jgi:hypothetical protein
MLGWNIFTKAVRLVIDNLNDALRISAVLYFVPAILVAAITFSMAPIAATNAGALAGFAGPSAILALVQLVAFLWIAVAWHRFVLLDERPAGWLPKFNGPRMLAYFGYSLLLLLIAIPFLIVGGLLAALLAFGGIPLLVLGGLIVLIAALIVGYRLALVLPASSVDKPIKLGQAWEATRGASGTIVALALISAVAAVVLDLPALAFGGPLAIIGVLWRVLMGWLELVVGVSILTTLYGYFVERREVAS